MGVDISPKVVSGRAHRKAPHCYNTTSPCNRPESFSSNFAMKSVITSTTWAGDEMHLRSVGKCTFCSTQSKRRLSLTLDVHSVNDSFGSVVKHLGYSVIISVVQKADIGHKAVVQNVIQVFLIFIFFLPATGEQSCDLLPLNTATRSLQIKHIGWVFGFGGKINKYSSVLVCCTP